MHGPPHLKQTPPPNLCPAQPPSTLARDGGSAAIDSGAVSKMNGGFRKSILMMEKENGRGKERRLMNGEFWDRSEVVTGESDGGREEKEGERLSIERTCGIICALANASDNGSRGSAETCFSRRRQPHATVPSPWR